MSDVTEQKDLTENYAPTVCVYIFVSSAGLRLSLSACVA